MLDILLPRSSHSSLEGLDNTRTKLQRMLIDGRLDERKVELYIYDPIEAATDNLDFEEASGQPVEELHFNTSLQEFLSASLRRELEKSRTLRKTRSQIMSVKDALELFEGEAYEILLASTIQVEQETSLIFHSEPLITVQDSLLALMTKNPEFMYGITHRQFEELICELFDKLGYAVELTARTRDGGCDLIAFGEDQLGIKTKYVVEAKHYKPENRVGVAIVRQVSAVKQKFGAHHGVLITSSYFTKDAIEENRVFYGLHLTDYDNLLGWIRRS